MITTIKGYSLMAAATLATVVVLAACGSSSTTQTASSGGHSSGTSQSSGGLPKASVSKIVDLDVDSPQTSTWDQGGIQGEKAAAKLLGASVSPFVSNISYNNAGPVFARLASQGYGVVIAQSSGYQTPLLQAAAQYPHTWFWEYSDLSTTKGLPNVVGININWNQVGYLMGAMACMVSTAKKVGIVVSEPIPAETHVIGGAQDAVAKYCGSKADLLHAFVGSFDDIAKAKAAGLAMLSGGADVLMDTADSSSAGVVDAAKTNPKVRYIGSLLSETSLSPSQVVSNADLNFVAGYQLVAKMLHDGTLKAGLYPSDVQNGGIVLSPAANVPDVSSVKAKFDALYNRIKTGKETVSSATSVNS